jgi:adenylate kinase family enzyme
MLELCFLEGAHGADDDNREPRQFSHAKLPGVTDNGSPRRVVVVGNSGAGKSRLSTTLADRFGLPLVHLDPQYWRPGWVKPSTEEWRQQVTELVARDEWVIDGNYGGTFDLRLPRADLVVWVDPHRLVCEYQALRRWWIGRNKQRVDLAEGCEEAIDWEFLVYIWNYRRGPAARLERALAEHAPDTPVIRLTSRRATRDWLSSL